MLQRVRKAVVVGLIALILSGCQDILQPLQPADALTDAEDNGAPVLIRVATCWPGLPLVQDLVAALGNGGAAVGDSNLSFDIIPTDSATALSLLAAGQADLAIITRRPTPEELTIETDGEEPRILQPYPLALGAIGVIVRRDWQLQGITRQELRGLFAGHYVDWKELRVGSEITGTVAPELVGLMANADSQQVFTQGVMGEETVSSTTLVMPHDRAVLEYVAEHPGAIGYVATAWIDERVHQVALDGLLSTPAQIRSSQYPLTFTLFMLNAPYAPREAQSLVALANSVKGQQIIGRRYLTLR